MKASFVLLLLLILFSCKDEQHQQKTDSLAKKMTIDSTATFRLELVVK